MADIRNSGGDTQASDHTDQVRGTYRMRRRRATGPIEPGSVAARLNRLFDTVRPPGRGPLRNFEVINALRARGIEMSAPYLSQLRAGSRSHPRLDTLRPLADFFGVSVAYFTDSSSAYTRYLEAELCWLEMAHDPQVRQITTALLSLPPDVREDILKSAESGHSAAE
nr:helix-turn-helix transcriptional regulator [Mycolicibacterium aubagnense]